MFIVTGRVQLLAGGLNCGTISNVGGNILVLEFVMIVAQTIINNGYTVLLICISSCINGISYDSSTNNNKYGHVVLSYVVLIVRQISLVYINGIQ